MSLFPNPNQYLLKENHPQGKTNTTRRKNESHDLPLWNCHIGNEHIMLGLDISKPSGEDQYLALKL